MPPILDAIGGHESRKELQLGVSVSQNMYPELRDSETDLIPRERIAMVPTRGFNRFDTVPGRVTGMAATQEKDERLVVSGARDIRIYENPDGLTKTNLTTSIDRAASDTVRYNPVFGASVGVTQTFYTAADGLIHVIRGRTATIDTPSGITPIGLTGDRSAGFLYYTCMEDRIVRCVRIDGVHVPARNLDVTDSGCQMPESVYFLASEGVLAVLDAIGGNAYLYELNGVTNEWKRISPIGSSNPFSLQISGGDYDFQQPAQPGGVYLNASEVWIADRASKRIYVFTRSNGVRKSRSAFHSGYKDIGHVCGFVGGMTIPRIYIDGSQQPDNIGRIYTVSTGASWRSGLAWNHAAAGSGRKVHLASLDDSGRYMAWNVDRKVHLIDLRTNRVIFNCAGSVDQIRPASGRFIGVDRTTGELKPSPPGAVTTVVGARRKSFDIGGSLSVPAWPRDYEGPVRSMFIGTRNVLVIIATRRLFIYDRQDMHAVPPELGSDRSFAAIGATNEGQCFMVRRGSADTNVSVYFYDDPPSTKGEVTSNVVQQRLNQPLPNGFTYKHVRSAAADADYVYIILDNGPSTASALVKRVAGSTSSAVSRVANRLHIPSTWGNIPADMGYTYVAGIDVADGVLRGAIRSTFEPEEVEVDDDGGADVEPGSTTVPPTIIRALKRTGQTGWSNRVVSERVNSGFSNFNSQLTHDANFLYDIQARAEPNEPNDDEDPDKSPRNLTITLRDGSPTTTVGCAAFWLANPENQSRYIWDPFLWQPDNSIAIESIRGRLYSWSQTRMRIYQLDLNRTGFPYALVATRDVGCSAPDSVAVVEERLIWLGASSGGGIRAWALGSSSDSAPEAFISHAIEEAFDQVGGEIVKSIAWTDDNSGHPTYVVGAENPGLTAAYDLHSKLWHTRTSLRLPGDTNDPFEWQDSRQGHQRVEHSVLWRNRQFMGGYGASGGIIAEPSLSIWRDIDGGYVERVRTFSVIFEKRLVRYPSMRVDANWGVGSKDGTEKSLSNPEFTLQSSNDGGRNWGRAISRKLSENKPPLAFYRLGSSRFRAYRIRCNAPIGFHIMGVYLENPMVSSHI